MSKGIKYLVVLVLFASAAASAPAQVAHNVMKVKVPFAFVAAGRSYPAGHYTVKLESGTGMLTLTSWPNTAVLLTASNDQAVDSSDAYLDFHRYGGRWVLREIALYGASRELPPGKLEAESAKAKPEETKIFAAKINK